jgi:hypothetical protein
LNNYRYLDQKYSSERGKIVSKPAKLPRASRSAGKISVQRARYSREFNVLCPCFEYPLSEFLYF